jgi:hypothetical protein
MFFSPLDLTSRVTTLFFSYKRLGFFFNIRYSHTQMKACSNWPALRLLALVPRHLKTVGSASRANNPSPYSSPIPNCEVPNTRPSLLAHKRKKAYANCPAFKRLLPSCLVTLKNKEVPQGKGRSPCGWA